MTLKINLKNQDNLTATKQFIDNYLLSKKKVPDNKIYLSFYLSEDSSNTPISRAIRFNKMMKEVDLCLRSQLNPEVARNIKKQIDKLSLVDIVRDNKMSLAFFATEEFSGFIFIPFPVHETIIVAQSLHLKPIIPWILSGDKFYLITLSSKLCRLLKGDSFSLTEVSSISLSDSEIEKYKKSSDKKLKHKILTRADSEFYQYVKDDKYPIILGGVEELHEIYQSVNRDPDLVKDRIVGNLDKSNFEELHKECLEIINSIKVKTDQELLLTYQEQRPYGKIIDQLEEITLAAIQGRVRSLIIASDRFLWGHLDKNTGKLVKHINKNLAIPEDDILDDLAELVISRGGDVTLFKYNEMPTDNEAVALLR